jgi:hypothetical protein
MRVPISELNIQEKSKTSDKKPTVTAPAPDKPRPDVPDLIALLTSLVTEDSPTGDVMRVLVRRLRYPDRAYTNQELEVLLALTLALEYAGMWP